MEQERKDIEVLHYGYMSDRRKVAHRQLLHGLELWMSTF